MKLYNRLSVARRRLVSSIVQYNDEPVWVSDERLEQPPEPEPPEWSPGDVFGNYVYLPENAQEMTPQMARYVARRYDVNLIVPYENRRGWAKPRSATWEAISQLCQHNNGRMTARWRENNRPNIDRDAVVDPGQISLRLSGIVPGRRSQWVPLTDPGFSFKPVKLGMLNYEDHAWMSYRVPVRRYSQGLTVENFGMQMIGQIKPGLTYMCSPNGVPDNLSISWSPELYDCITGNYPSMRCAMNSLANRQDPGSMAVSRDLAVEVDPKLGLGFLWFKRARIGYTEDGDTFKLSPDYSFLSQTLEEEGIKYAS